MTTVLEKVIGSIATTTRYPEQLLVPSADLENDLGIDSVKRVEIVTALADAFDLDLLSQERDPSIRTIQHIADWVENHLNGAQPTVPAADPEPAAPVAPTASPMAPGEELRQSPADANAPYPTPPTPGVSPPGVNGGMTQPAHGNGMTQPARGNGMTQPAHGKGMHSTVSGAGPASHSFRNDSVSPPFAPSTRFAAQPHRFHGPIPRFTDNPMGGSPDTPVASGQFAPNPTAHTLPPTVSPRRNLQGRVAFITGSGRGVGRVIARYLASHGATVIVNSFHSRDHGDATVDELRRVGHSAIHLWGSVANPDHVESIFQQIESQVGHLDILVCNASDGSLGSFTDVTLAEWDTAFHTNITGHYHCAMRAAPLMQRRGGGSMVTMSSIAAHRYVEGLGGQGVIKAAVESMTRHLACEFAEWGIRANCVSGGPVYGEVMSQYPESRATFNYWESIVPDRQLCSPMELASAVGFLVSDEAKGVNGSVWTVDHGASTRSHSRSLPQAVNGISTANV